MATTDGGARWFAQESGTRHGLWGVCFADASHGWAVGGSISYPAPTESATLALATTDGGAHWTTVLKTPGEPLSAVACADASHVWAAIGNPVPATAGTAKILASSDAGRTWTEQYANEALGEVQDFAFSDTTHGWAVTYTGEVLATTDGGVRWRVLATPSGNDGAWRIAFADATHGWVMASRPAHTSGQDEGPGPIWVTTDGGAHWEESGSSPQGMYTWLTDLACADAEHVWTAAVGPDPMFRSIDGGATWLAPTDPIGHLWVFELTFGDVSHGWAVASDGSSQPIIIATSDGGATWSAQAGEGQPTAVEKQLYSIDCAPDLADSDQ